MDHLLSGGALLGGVNDIIRALPSAPHPSLPVGARLLSFVEAWSAITQDSWALSILRKGYRIPFAKEPPLSLSPILFPVAHQHLNHLREEVQILLEKRAVEIVRDTTSPGFYSRIFLVKKKTGRFRLIIDLSSLNKMMKVDHFQMETAASIRRAIPPGAWAVSIDLMDAYLHIPIHPASRKYLRFSLEGTIYQFRALPFGISTAPFVFTNLMEIVAGHIRSLGPNIHQYFDDWLVHRLSQESLLSDLSLAWEIITSLGLIPNPLKSDLVPSQDFVYVGMRFLTHIGIVRVPEERVNKILVLLFRVLQVQFITAREFLSMLGSLNAAADLIQLGRLHNYETSSVPSSGQLETSPRQFGPIYSNIPFMSCSNQMVDESFHLCGWNSPCYTNPRFPSVFRCQPFGLGRTFRTPRSRGSGTVGYCFPRPSHQQFGVTSSFPSTPTFSESHLQFMRDGSIRQFISSGLPQEARGDPLSISVHASLGSSLLVSSSEYSHSSQAYSREIECFGRQPVSPRPNSPHRMVSRSGDSSPNFQSLGYSSDRSFRHQIKPSSAPVCFSSTGQQGLCSGCYVTRMEKPIRIRISSIQTCSPGSKQDKGFQQSVHSHSPVLASEELVFSHFESHNRLPVHRGLVSQHQGKVLHQNPAMLHLHAWKLSGVKSEVDTFLNSLPSVSLNPAESLRSRSTLRGGRYSRIGVCKGKLILSIPL